MMQKINIITLGCSKNLVDSERLLRQLQASGLAAVHESDRPAGVVLVNTCGFIGDAKEESVETILRCAAAKRSGAVQRLYVFGCLSQRYRNELREELPEVDGFFGVDEPEKIVAALGGTWRPELLAERTVTTPSHYAWLKISEGCDRGCSYCAIPLIRGKHRSVPLEALLEEARLLAAGGVRELLITAQDTTYYGLDLYGRRRLADLLNALSAVEGIEWIRLHYAYPAQFPPEVLSVLRDNPKLCKYLDIPLQHVSDAVLQQMRRGITGAQTRALVAQLRREVPGIALRTTLMVGHPGEDEAAFDELVQFVREVRFERLGVFCYSEEEGTFGAKHLPDTLSSDEKERRRAHILKIQADISQALNGAKIGRTCRTVIDRREGDYYIGRTQYDSPEVDNEVLIAAAGTSLQAGRFYEVTITAADEFDLFGCVQ